MGGFACPRCRMAFSSRPLLRAHEEKLCLGTPAAGSSCLPGGDPPPAEGSPGTAGRPQDASVTLPGRAGMGQSVGTGTGMGAGLGRAAGEETGRHSHRSWVQPSLNRGDLCPPPLHCTGSPRCLFLPKPEKFVLLSIPPPPFLPVCLCEVGVSQHGGRAEPRCLLVLPGLPPAVRAQRGPGQARGAPLGDVLTPRERALLRMADPASRRLTAEQGERSRQLAPPQGHRQWPQELLEAHERHVAEIRARTQQLEQQREGLCQRLAALGTRVAATPHPEQEELELSQAPEVLRDHVGWLAHGGATLRLDTLLPAAGPLAAEARALRLSYLRAGGRDLAILDQLLHLQVEATVLEKGTMGLSGGRRMGKPQPQPWAHPLAGTLLPQPATEAPPAVPAEPPAAGARGLDAALLAVELENRRLEDELLALKVRRERRADAGSRAAQRQAEELAQLQAQVGMLRCHAEQTGPRLPPTILPPPVAPPLPPALAAPELFTVRASSQVPGYFQVPGGRGDGVRLLTQTGR
ncbi:hypothetical protein QYF61_000467 [Mycteria americana]|uniref:Coiled-coil domain-containing protein 17 n=1 Tax=Mycteria americana TaxID=33587 RepID=A0AAN7S4H0_MYCAM|nr:hypothetical protein QYF61_000467 [Mycteria americana]